MDKYFVEKCGRKKSCEIDPNWISQQEQYFNYKDFTQDLNILPKLSEHCLHRVRWQNVTSPYLIIVVGCGDDTVYFPLYHSEVHKDVVGLIVVTFDIASVMIMALFFNKLQKINEQYVNIIDNMSVQMKDFAIQINDLKVDKYS